MLATAYWAASAQGWCYPTGRCVYLPSVICYRHSMKLPPPPFSLPPSLPPTLPPLPSRPCSSSTDPVPRGLLTLCPVASSGPQGQ